MYKVSRKIYSEVITLIKKEAKCDAEKAMVIADGLCSFIEDDINKGPTVDEKVKQAKDTLGISTNTIPAEVLETPEAKKARIMRMVNAGAGQVDKNGNFTPTSRKVSFETVTGQQ